MYRFTRCILACFIALMWRHCCWGRWGFLQLLKIKDYCFYVFFFPFPLTPYLFSHSPGSITPSSEVSFPLQSHEFRSTVVLLLLFKFCFWRPLEIKEYNLPHIFCSCFLSVFASATARSWDQILVSLKSKDTLNSDLRQRITVL